MEKNFDYSWTAPESDLVFEFSLHSESYCRVTAKIFWRNNPGEIQVLKIPDNQDAYFNKQYFNGGYVYGDLKLQIEGGDIAVIGIIRYGHQGKNDEQPFEGIMAEFDETSPVFPIPYSETCCECPSNCEAGSQSEYCCNCPSNCDAGPQPENCCDEPAYPIELVVDDYSGPLFPYVYVRKWPKISANDLQLNFVQYVMPSPPSSSFYSALCSARASGREQMEAVAVDFIEGNPPYAGEFISQMSDLTGPISLFPEIYVGLSRMDNCISLKVKEKIGQILSLDPEKITQYLTSTEYCTEKESVWESYFSLVIISGYDKSLLVGFVETLVICHLMELVFLPGSGFNQPTAKMLQQMVEASILLPQEIFPLPPLASSPPISPSSASGWIEPYSIGDLQMVRQRFVKYVPGEVAYIENIMQGEIKEISRRKTHRVEDRQESATADQDMLENSANDEGKSLVDEIQKVLAAKNVTQTYSNFNSSYGAPTQATLNGSWTRLTDARTDSDDITRYARDILNKSVSRITRKVSAARSSSVLHESEEIAKSVIDNRGSDKNLICVFKWLNRIFEAHVVNYGSRLMMEFMIADPAARFIRKEKLNEGALFLMPPSPEKIGITSYKSITFDNYAEFAACYLVTDIKPPPPQTKFVCATLRGGEETQIAVPTGYSATNAYVIGFSDATTPSVLVGKQLLTPGSTATDLGYGEDLTIPIAVMGATSGLSSPPASDTMVNVEVQCNLTVTAQDEWKIMTYAAIMKGYQQLLAQYMEMTRHNTRPPARSPFAARCIISKEIKRGCIDLLFERMCALRGWPALNCQEASDLSVNEPGYLQFFDEAMEWNEMAISFYEGNGSYSMPDCAGEEDRFAAFLDAKHARVLIPVRPGLSMKFLYFLSSGMLWPIYDAMSPVDPADVALVNELKKVQCEKSKERCVGKPWKVIVPTSLQIVGQANGFDFSS